jgi:hypothetical protein
VLSARAEYAIPWYSVDAGGSMFGAGGAYGLGGTTGQPDAGVVSGGAFTLTGGFWAGAATAAAQPGDCDADGDVDLADYADLEACLNGPQAGLDAGCSCFDFDADGDVDLQNFGDFQQFLGGN